MRCSCIPDCSVTAFFQQSVHFKVTEAKEESSATANSPSPFSVHLERCENTENQIVFSELRKREERFRSPSDSLSLSLHAGSSCMHEQQHTNMKSYTRAATFHFRNASLMRQQMKTEYERNHTSVSIQLSTCLLSNAWQILCYVRMLAP